MPEDYSYKIHCSQNHQLLARKNSKSASSYIYVNDFPKAPAVCRLAWLWFNFSNLLLFMTNWLSKVISWVFIISQGFYTAFSVIFSWFSPTVEVLSVIFLTSFTATSSQVLVFFYSNVIFISKEISASNVILTNCWVNFSCSLYCCLKRI